MLNSYYKERLELAQFAVGDAVKISGSNAKSASHGYGVILEINEDNCSIKIRWQNAGIRWYSPKTLRKVDKEVTFLRRTYHRQYPEDTVD